MLTFVMPDRIISPQTAAALHITPRFNGQDLAVGTGFVAKVSQGYVLITNRHNVTGRNNITGKLISTTGAIPDQLAIMHNKDGDCGKWIEVVEPLFDRDVPRWREHPTLGARADFVALPLTQTQGVAVMPYDLIGARKNVAVGPAEPVSVIGYPFGKSAEGFAIWATGFIASDLALNFDNLPIFLIDCRTRPGQSGSPVIAFRSAGASNTGGSLQLSSEPMVRFMGIYSGRIDEKSDIGMVWKASAIRELLDTFTPRTNYGLPGLKVIVRGNAAPT